MAKEKKAKDVEVDVDEQAKAALARKKLIEAHMKDLRKVTKSTSLSESKIAVINDWIDTGDLGVNSIISGSMFRGLPAGRVTTFYGPPSSGKSYLAANSLCNALSKNNYDRVYYFDSEGGGLFDLIKSRGVDTDLIEHIPVVSVEDAQVKIINTLKGIQELQETVPDFKVFCVLDSLGMLPVEKVADDAIDKKKATGDMGGAAKMRNNLIRAICMPVVLTNTAFVVINHSYDNPGQMHPSKIKDQAGGKGVSFVSHVCVQMDKKFEKEGNAGTDQFFKTVILRAFTIKNRVSPAFHESEIFLDLSTGPKKYFGLLESAKRYEFIIQNGARYTVPSYKKDKSYFLADILDNEEVWNSFLPALDEKLKQERSYAGQVPPELQAMLEEQPEEEDVVND